jgi:diadenosine tetraphosphatase ApaH/serine/threonine PP2A family protein phosphatase
VRITIVSDVHANLAALEAVLQHAEQRQALDEVWALGDLVGYGPQPGECLARLRGYPLYAVIGNHDLAAVGGMDTRDFNPDAAAANAWTAKQLSKEDSAFLSALPETLVRDGITMVHGSLRHPVWEYIFTEDAAIGQFELQETPYSFVGHTHVPMVFEEVPGRRKPIIWPLSDGDVLELRERRLIVNPGGVGQPRDGDPRTAYAVYDADERTVSVFRLPYDIERTQQLMEQAGLPERLIRRLSYGR